MRIVLGVDTEDHKAAVELLVRLKFESPSVELVHVLEMLLPPGWKAGPQEPADLIDKFIRLQEAEGLKALEDAAAELKQYGISPHRTVLNGSAANRLMDHADGVGADLIAVGSGNKGRVEACLIGSVGRKLVIGAKQSILIAKRKLAAEGPLTAVLATDHSDYANRCIDKLVQFAPQGIGRLTVMTAYPKELVRAMESAMGHFKIAVGPWMDEKLHEQNKRVDEKLGRLGWKCESRVIESPPNEAVRQVMQESGADLLIMGAHGHGMLERLTIGSISFYQVVAEPHSVLVLRA